MSQLYNASIVFGDAGSYKPALHDKLLNLISLQLFDTAARA
jgi:hypothetical protein